MSAAIPLTAKGLRVEAQVAALCAYLRARGQVVALSDEIRLSVLVTRLVARGPTPRSMRNWARLLVPVLARGERNQEALTDLIEEWLRLRLPEEVRPAPETRGEAPKRASRRVKVRRLIIAGSILVLAAGLWVAYLLFATGVEVADVAVDIATDTPIGEDDQIGPLIDHEPELSNTRYLLMAMLLALPLLTLALALVPYLWQAGWLVKKRTASPTARVREIPEIATNVYTSTAARQAFRAFAASKRVPSRRLDAGQSIARTNRAAGYPQIAFRTRFQRREYVIVAETAGAWDHVSLIVDPLVAELIALSAQVTVYEALGSVAQMRHVSGNRTLSQVARLSDIVEEHRGARILLIGTGASLFNSYSGQLLQVPGLRTASNPNMLFPSLDLPTLLTTTPEPRWGPREQALQAAGVNIFPASAAGLNAAAQLDSGEARWTDPRPIPSREDPFLAHLDSNATRLGSEVPPPDSERAALARRVIRFVGPGDGLKMLVALSILGRNFPRLSRFAAAYALRSTPGGEPDGLLGEDTAQRLARLAWMRVGGCPGWLCRDILSAADAKVVAAQEIAMCDMIFALDHNGPVEEAPRVVSDGLTINLDLTTGQKLGQAMGFDMHRVRPSGLVEQAFRGFGRSRARLRAGGRRRHLNPIVALLVATLTLGGVYFGLEKASAVYPDIKEGLEAFNTLMFGSKLGSILLLILSILAMWTAADVVLPRPGGGFPWWRPDRKLALRGAILKIRRNNGILLSGGPWGGEKYRPLDTSDFAPLEALLIERSAVPRVPWCLYPVLCLAGLPVMFFGVQYEEISSQQFSVIGILACLAAARALHPRLKHFLRRLPHVDTIVPNRPPTIMITCIVLGLAVAWAVSLDAIASHIEGSAGILPLAALTYLILFCGMTYSIASQADLVAAPRLGLRVLGAVGIYAFFSLFFIISATFFLGYLYFGISIFVFWALFIAYSVQSCIFGLRPERDTKKPASGRAVPISARAEFLGCVLVPLSPAMALIFLYDAQIIDFYSDAMPPPIPAAAGFATWAVCYRGLVAFLPLGQSIARRIDDILPGPRHFLEVSLLIRSGTARERDEMAKSNESAAS